MKRLAPAALCLAAYVAWDALGRPALGSGQLRFLLEIPRTFGLPGWLLLEALGWSAAPPRRELAALERLGLAVSVSLALAALAAQLVLASESLSIEALGWLLDAVCLVCLVVALAAQQRRAAADGVCVTPDDRGERQSQSRAARATLVMTLVLASGLALHAGWVGGFVGQPSDTWMHLAVARRVLETGQVVTQSPFVSAVVPFSYAESWHTLLVRAVVDPADAPLHELWRLAPVASVAAAALAFAGLAASLVSSRGGYWVALICFAVGAGGVRLAASAGALPAAAGMVMLLGALGCLWRWTSVGRGLELGLLGLLTAGGLVVHPVDPLLVGLVSVALVVTLPHWAGLSLVLALGRTAAAALVIGALALGYLPLRYAHLVSERVADAPVDPSDELWHLPFGLEIVDPEFIPLELSSPMVWLALALLPWALAARGESAPNFRHGLLAPRGTSGRALVAALVVTALLVPFFPPLVWLIQWLKLPAFLVSRAAGLWPYPLLLALAYEQLAGRARWLGVCAAAAALAMSEPAPRVASESAAGKLLALQPRLSGSLDSQAVVATDLVSGDMLPGLCGARIVAGVSWHVGSSAGQLELRSFLAEPWQSSDEALEFVRSYGVTHVLANPAESAWPGYHEIFYSAATLELLNGNPALFEPLLDEAGVSLFRVNQPLAAGALAGKDSPPLVTGAPAEAVQLRAGGGPAERLGPGLFRVPRAVTLQLERSRAQGLDRADREVELQALLVVPEGFEETRSSQRILRRLSGAGLGYATSRWGPHFRIDHRFYLERPPVVGQVHRQLFRFELPGDAQVGDRFKLLVGPAAVLPEFPKPLGPALDRWFSELALLEVGVPEP